MHLSSSCAPLRTSTVFTYACSDNCAQLQKYIQGVHVDTRPRTPSHARCALTNVKIAHIAVALSRPYRSQVP
ncbi:hypothetical protein HETIRDRAFT_149225 [Heterobasidion irregulare TC 32-1]|uniref:Uncharacterized protein n=1 Tax=Heterobasidion irregulare (strain TC 32-1) TaxID=747525 RepID=W4KC95_HETIT|nr:uncharacterized protein HETIRDRAFT_149225 [Heterobasidion irregulare TC 32-1]ETW83388.1 hypothetical protein HETIRDRAFT_149225 [Heterobasidion irregulare TC 32-1]